MRRLMTDEQCQSCHLEKPNTVAAMVGGKYYQHICPRCLGNEDVTSSSAAHERNRQYEDNAQDTIQPYDAVGPNPEFYRLYPEAATKVFSPEIIEQLKKKI